MAGRGFPISLTRLPPEFANVAVVGEAGFEEEDARGLGLTTLAGSVRCFWLMDATVGV
jgi:hypothetical protein